MRKAKRLGIWMDETKVNLTEFNTDPVRTNIIETRILQEGNAQGESNNKKKRIIMSNLIRPGAIKLWSKKLKNIMK